MSDWTAHAVRYASLTSDRETSFLRYKEYGQPNAPIVCDFYFWIFTSGDRIVLLDSGYSPRHARRPGLNWLCDVPAAVSAFGVSPADVSTIVYSHMHSDHVGNLPAFPNATALIQRSEWDFWTGVFAGRGLYREFRDEVQLAELRHAEAQGRLMLLDGDAEVALGLATIALPGHTPGSQGLRVTNGEDSIVLTSDAVHYYDELTLDYPFFIVDHLQGMYASFDRVRALAAAGDRVVAGHDSSDLDRYERKPLLGGDLLTLL